MYAEDRVVDCIEVLSRAAATDRDREVELIVRMVAVSERVPVDMRALRDRFGANLFEKIRLYN